MTFILRYALRSCVAFLPSLPMAVAAQRADSTALRLSSVVRSAVESYNAATTRRVTGALDVPAGTIYTGDVAVLNGPVTVAGRIAGTVVAINADVRFAPGAEVGQHVIVVGGNLVGQDGAKIGGEIRVQAELLRYHLDGPRLVADGEPVYDESWWTRHRVRHEFRRGEAFTDFFYLASRSYNRVEGWSFAAGPRFQRTPDWGKFKIEAFGVVRTVSPVRWDNQTLGHDARAEVQFGKPIGLALGARAFDVVEPTESWQLGNTETGLSSVLLHRDYRDYYVRHGGQLYARFQAWDEADLTIGLSDEQWSNRAAGDPWSATRGHEPWRANPTMDPGSMHLLTTRLRVDTREQTGSPWAGWYLVAEMEKGAGRITRLGAPVQTFAVPTPEAVSYTRGFADVRRYNRIAPDFFLNFRVAAGGWMSGDALPTQRRLSVGGPGTLPGFDFRDTGGHPDILTCSGGVVQTGAPAQCDRVALAQVELRSGFLWSALRNDAEEDWWRPGLNHRTQWVLFADAGRGWKVGTADGSLTSSKDAMPSFNSYKTDLGIGIDFGGFGAYWAKPVSDEHEPARFIVRLERRF